MSERVSNFNLVTKLFSLTAQHIGKAVKENPGYLKLRKIRAAQRVAHVVSHYPSLLSGVFV